jgi:DNA modification methylase
MSVETHRIATNIHQLGTAGEPPYMNIAELTTVNNPTSIHGIYPYRGKISAVDAEGLIKQFKPKARVLDPFCGSGTIIYEAARRGHKAIGVDANPIAEIIAAGKVSMNEPLAVYILEAESIIAKAKLIKSYDFKISARKHFHLESFKQIQATAKYFDGMSPYLKACFVGAIALTARGCNDYMWTSSTVGKDINPKRYIDFYEKFLQKIKKHYFPIKVGLGKIHFGDARNLKKILKPKSIDIVFSSPPYFDCLDYTAYYARIVYAFLEVNHLEVKAELIQQFSSYKDDMSLVMAELDRVLVPGGKVIFVVGDKKVHGKVIQGESFFDELSPWKKIASIERSYKGTSSAIFDSINKTERKEQVLVWQKKM